MTDIMTPMWLICRERHAEKVPTITRVLVRTLEKTAILLSDVSLVETVEVAEFLAQEYNVETSRFAVLPVGAQFPIESMAPTHAVEVSHGFREEAFVALYHGKFIPQHGIGTILEGAQLLRHEPAVVIVLAGEGQESSYAREFISRHALENVRQTGYVSDMELTALLRRADVCLGVFGTSSQSRITAHNKIFEALAMGKPLISGRSSPIERLFHEGEELLLVERGSSRALADAILRLKADPSERQNLAEGALRAVQRVRFLPDGLARQLIEAIRKRKARIS